MRKLRLQTFVMLLSLATLASAGANLPPERRQLSAFSVPQLKAIYLECDQLASATLLDFDTVALCSMVSDELLERGFGGNFQKLLDWWRDTRKTPAPNQDSETS